MSAHMIELAAKALCKCNVAPVPEQEADNWDVYGGRLKADAKTMLEACGAKDLLEVLIALQPIIDAAESNASGNPEWSWVSDLVEKRKAAIAKAYGVQQ